MFVSMKTLVLLMLVGFAMQVESASLSIEPIGSQAHEITYFEDSVGLFRWQMYATATGGDCFIRDGLILDGKNVFGQTFNQAYSFSSNGVLLYDYTSLGMNIFPNGYYGHYEFRYEDINWTGSLWRIPEGETLELTIQMRVRSSENSLVQMELNSIEYSENPNWSITKNIDLENWSTPIILIGGTNIPEPSTVAMLFVGVFLGLRRRR